MDANVSHSGAPLFPPRWQATLADLMAAIAVSKVIALVGSQGSGKTYTLRLLAQAAFVGTAKMRIAGEVRASGITLDLVEGMDTTPAYAGTMVAAIRPHELSAFQLAHPGARSVNMHPMSGDEIRAMIELRRCQFGLPSGSFTLKAKAALERRCGGHPGALDLLLTLANQASKVDQVSRISADHIERAWTEVMTPKGEDTRPAPGLAPCHLPHASDGTPFHKLEQEPQILVESILKAPPMASVPMQPSRISAWELLNMPLALPVVSLRRTRRLAKRGKARYSAIRLTGLIALVVVTFVGGAVLTQWHGVTVNKLQTYLDAASTDVRRYIAALDAAQLQNRAATPPTFIEQAQPRQLLLQPTSEPVIAPVQAQSSRIPPGNEVLEKKLDRFGVRALPDDVANLSLSGPLSHPAMPEQGSATNASMAAMRSRELMPSIPARGPHNDAATWRAAQLLGLGKAMVLIGEVDDAKRMFQASAVMGNAEANAAYRTLSPGLKFPSE